MKRTGQKAHLRRSNFREILKSIRPKSRQRLAEKAKLANQIAKISLESEDRIAAYAVKTAALEQGLRCCEFELRGDELARPGLAIVATGSHGQLHIRINRLSRDILNRPDVQLRLCGIAA